VHDTPASIQLKFADDMVSYASGVDASEIQSDLQRRINEMSQWAKKWDMVLNADKTKAILFGSKSTGALQLSLNGTCIEQVPEFKYLGVILDDQMKFEHQAEYSASKVRRALGKLCRLFNGRKGISAKLGIELYKCLVRPHLEFSVSAWATTTEKGIQLLEKVQGECLRRILGAKSHSSTEALNVIANVLPIRIRIQELCTREYVRILRKPVDSKIHMLLQSTVLIRNRFTPMSYIKYVARDFQRSLGNMEIEMETKVADSGIFDDITVKMLLIAADLGGKSNRTSHQVAEGRSRVERLVEVHRGKSVMVFTDGSVNSEYSGVGGAVQQYYYPWKQVRMIRPKRKCSVL